MKESNTKKEITSKELKKESEIFFVRGFQRSGTNWLSNMLNLHPDISCTGEFHFEFIHKGFQETFKQQFGLLKRQPKEFRKAYFDFVRATIINYAGGALFCGDRTPAGLRSSFFPQQKYILITRDGRDCLVSWTYHAFRREINMGPGMQEKATLWQKDPNYFENNKHLLLDQENYVKNIAKQWNQRILRDLKAIELQKEGKLKFEYFWIRYAEMHENIDQLRKDVYAFIGADPAKAPPLNDLTKPGFKQHNAKSHYRKGVRGDWRNYLTKQQLNWFMEEARPAIKALNLDEE